MKDETPDLPVIGGLAGMNNRDFSIDDGVEEALLERTHYTRYAGWNFNGHVWHDGKQFVCQPWVYHVPQQLHKADSLKDLMHSVSQEYGYE